MFVTARTVQVPSGTVRIETGTPPREAVNAMFASALRERNGQASDGILGPRAGDDRRKGRDRCPRAAGTHRKPRTQSPSSDRVERVAGKRRCLRAMPGQCNHSRDGTGSPRANGTDARLSNETTFGIVPIDDRTAMPDRRKARRDRKDIEAGTRLFGAAPVPVTGQRTPSDRWSAGFHIPCRLVEHRLPPPRRARLPDGQASGWRHRGAGGNAGSLLVFWGDGTRAKALFFPLAPLAGTGPGRGGCPLRPFADGRMPLSQPSSAQAERGQCLRNHRHPGPVPGSTPPHIRRSSLMRRARPPVGSGSSPR